MGWMQLALQFGKICSANLVEETAIDPGMDAPVSRVMVGIFSDPTVMMDRRVQWLGGIADVMAHHAHDVDDVRLGVGNFLRRATILLKSFQAGKSRFQLAVIFRDRPRQKTNQFASVILVL